MPLVNVFHDVDTSAFTQQALIKWKERRVSLTCRGSQVLNGEARPTRMIENVESRLEMEGI